MPSSKGKKNLTKEALALRAWGQLLGTVTFALKTGRAAMTYDRTDIVSELLTPCAPVTDLAERQ